MPFVFSFIQKYQNMLKSFLTITDMGMWQHISYDLVLLHTHVPYAVGPREWLATRRHRGYSKDHQAAVSVPFI